MGQILIVAGEPSGDALAAEFLRALRDRAPGTRAFGATGPQLEEAGAERVVATSDLSVMGLVEVVSSLPTVLGALRRLASEARERRPDGAVLVDSPDFNLRLARRLRGSGIPVVQYVGPTVWAWREGRIRTLEKNVRRLLVTLPFEPEVYAGADLDVVYVGNPAVDRIPSDPPPRPEMAGWLDLPEEAPWVALLPGSRSDELERMGPLLSEAARRVRGARPEVRFLAPIAPGAEPPAVVESLSGGPAVRFVAERRYEALGHCAAAIATSGTASLELALLGVPHVVGYRMATLSWWIARALVDVEHVALPNLIAGRRVVPELLQRAATPEALAGPVSTWLVDRGAREEVRKGLGEVAEALGPGGVADRAAAATASVLGLGSAAPGEEGASTPSGV
ncbi:MAG: lipid-A-disaccharide synthase [Gemmatimonadota bacterium]|nr:lipid-A-disaccharide synthase [Gemmatimonadota bacterium]